LATSEARLLPLKELTNDFIVNRRLLDNFFKKIESMIAKLAVVLYGEDIKKSNLPEHLNGSVLGRTREAGFDIMDDSKCGHSMLRSPEKKNSAFFFLSFSFLF